MMKLLGWCVCAALLALPGVPGLAAAGQVVEPRDVIVVEGFAEAELEPDYIEWTAEITTRDKSPKLALEVNDAVMQSLLKIAKSADVDAKDIVKGRPVIEQQFREDRRDEDGAGVYESTEIKRRVTFNLRDLDEFEDALQAVHALGVVYQIKYKSSAYDKTVEKVKREALLDAKSQAEDQADTLGQKIGPAVRVNVEQGYFRSGGGLFGSDDPDWRDEDDSEAAGPDGKVRVRAYAFVDFKLER